MPNQPKTKDILTGNEDLEELKDALLRCTPDEEHPHKQVEQLTGADVVNALYALADELQELQSLRRHTHRTKTIEVIESI